MESVSSVESTIADMDTDRNRLIDLMIDLHTKVFSTHQVLGWYRVDDNTNTNNPSGEYHNQGKDDNNSNFNSYPHLQPTHEDLTIAEGWMKDHCANRPLLLLMDGSDGEDRQDVFVGKNTYSHPQAEDPREKLERIERLPLAIYETMPTTNTDVGVQNSKFTNVEFELEAFEPERIAVEHVSNIQPAEVITQPLTNSESAKPLKKEVKLPAAQQKGSETKTSQGLENEIINTMNSSSLPPTSQSELHLQTLISSIDSMNVRISIILDFLRNTQQNKIKPDHNLLRKIDSLVAQLPFIMGHAADLDIQRMSSGTLFNETKVEYDNMLLISYLGSIAKTANIVQSFSDKVLMSNEANTRDKESSRERLRKI
mmetsp:Transcript_6531/g.9462  ORF Transcript_6531/g.9462 Transcript_6531/m.9462 type:complete len:369 (+) Transcript_6531:241-1347(+)